MTHPTPMQAILSGPRGMGLTARQASLLAFLRSKPLCPSYQEMADALGLSSKGQVHALLTALEERGYIRRLANRARAIEVCQPEATPASSGMSKSPCGGVVTVPLLGRIYIDNQAPHPSSERKAG